MYTLSQLSKVEHCLVGNRVRGRLLERVAELLSTERTCNKMAEITDLLPTPLRVLTLLLALTSSCYGVTVIDLTHRLKSGESITWPVNPKFNFTILIRGRAPEWNNKWIENNKFEMPEHMGTHMDAPAHGAQGRWRMHQVPAENLVGPGVVVDVSNKVTGNPEYSLTVDDLKDWESEHGRMPERAVVLVNAGWASRYPDRNKVFGTNNFHDVASYRFPSVTAQAARWLAEERKILALGVDTSSPDTGKNKQMPVHEILLQRSILILENVANLHQLPPTGTTIVVGALNIHDGSGAPMRLLALKGDYAGSGGWKLQGSCLSYLVAAAVSVGLALVRRGVVL